MAQTWAQFIKSYRKKIGLTQADFANLLNVSPAAISNWERGQEPSEANKKDVEKVLSQYFNSQKSEISSFGVWLREYRTKANLSVPQLAEQSKVSLPTIYNLENGKIQNPQDLTREKLTRALKKKLPKNIVEKTKKEQAIEGLGSLMDFEPYADDERPTCAGVYVLYDISQRPIYVGKSKNIKTRLRQHSNGNFWFRQPIVVYGSFIQVEDPRLRHQLEQTLIKFLKLNAVINVQSVEGFAQD